MCHDPISPTTWDVMQVALDYLESPVNSHEIPFFIIEFEAHLCSNLIGCYSYEATLFDKIYLHQHHNTRLNHLWPNRYLRSPPETICQIWCMNAFLIFDENMIWDKMCWQIELGICRFTWWVAYQNIVTTCIL